jgi:hypothetical protein
MLLQNLTSRNLHTLEIRFGKLASMVLRFGRRIKFIGFSESIGDVAADDAAELGSAATESFY